MLLDNQIKKLFETDRNAVVFLPLTNKVFLKGPKIFEPLKVING